MKTEQTPKVKLKKLIETMLMQDLYFSVVSDVSAYYRSGHRPIPARYLPGYAIMSMKPEQRELLKAATAEDFSGLRLTGITEPWPKIEPKI